MKKGNAQTDPKSHSVLIYSMLTAAKHGNVAVKLSPRSQSPDY